MHFGKQSQFRPAVSYVKTIFLSDIHLGTRGCKAAQLIDFLNHHHASTIYLVGDIFDTMHALGPNVTAKHHEAIKLLSERAKSGTRVIYIPGNHDSFFRSHIGQSFFGFEIQLSATHHTADGRKFLVVHGDECDPISVHLPHFEWLGSKLEALGRAFEDMLNNLSERFFGKKIAVLDWLVRKIGPVICNHNHFQERILTLARNRNHDGVICGHIHQGALKYHGHMIYANCGDWVDHCSGLIEKFDGSLELVRWLPATAKSVVYDGVFAMT